PVLDTSSGCYIWTSFWVVSTVGKSSSLFISPPSDQEHNKQSAMAGREILNKMKEKVGLSSSSGETGKGKSKMSKHVTHGYHLVKGKSYHDMEDYVFAQFKNVDDNELGLFAIFDGHLSHEPDFWTKTESAIRRAYRVTDKTILDKAVDLGRGGSTAVTAILINCKKLVVANVGDSRAVICNKGVAKQLSIDHEPSTERKLIENRGGFVSTFPGDVPRVDGRLAVARAFGDKSLKEHLSSEPDVFVEMIDDATEFIILASDGVWKDARLAAKQLTEEALARKSTDDISCIVV
ncbi:Protein phosphatase 2C, partial [Cynara cardunculus var. scolymus]